MGVIHPFAHLNSNYAAARLGQAAGFVRAGSAESFTSVLRSTPAADDQIGAPADEPEAAPAPNRSRTAQTPAETAAPADDAEPAPAPAHSRTAQTDGAPAQPQRHSSVPHFLSVPESVQYPNGPYRQAPAEHGGEWWLTNPFTGTEPWLTQGFEDPYAVPEAAGTEASPEFLAVFGPRPNAETHPNRQLRSAAVADWERNLDYFQGVGLPEGFSEAQLQAAGDLFESWGMGRPILYEGRYGWTATFPSAQVQGFEASPFATLEAPHLVVARYQIEMMQHGETPAEKHPFVPPQVFEEEPKTV